MMGLPEGSKGFAIGLATYTHHRRVNDLMSFLFLFLYYQFGEIKLCVLMFCVVL